MKKYEEPIIKILSKKSIDILMDSPRNPYDIIIDGEDIFGS